MTPSLNELVGAMAQRTGVGFEDAEDMFDQTLVLNDKVGSQAGIKVKVIKVDMEAGTHVVEFPGGVVVNEFSNDEDVYKPIE